MRFGRPKVLLPVVHCIRPSQAHVAIRVAIDNGADGVFLINQGGMSVDEIVALADDVRAESFVGVNLLGESIPSVFGKIAGAIIAGLWRDDAGISVTAEITYARVAMDFNDRRKRSAWRGLYFGGVAFKYRASVAPEHYGDVARAAMQMGVDVITTSGPATGEPPTVEKVAAMRAAIGDHALAIASGGTPENVSGFLPYVDAFLVATGIESSFGVFDAGKVRALADQIHATTP